MLMIANSNLIVTFVTAKYKIVTMARPISADTANKVTLHVNGGYRYASAVLYLSGNPCQIRIVQGSGFLLCTYLSRGEEEKRCLHIGQP